MTGPRIVCKTITEYDDIKTETISTIKFNKDNYVNYQHAKTIQTFESEETYNYYASYLEEEESGITNEYVKYTYELDKDNKTITTIMIYEEGLFDYSNVADEEKEQYLASNLITRMEENGSKCEFIKITKKELGLE